MVVVQREHEAHPLDAFLALGTDDDKAVGLLSRDAEGRSQDRVPEGSRRVAGKPRGEGERERTTRPDRLLEHRGTISTGRDGGTLASLGEAGMRTTWDAAAASEQVELYVGDPARGREELEGFFGRLGADPRGGLCVELGCGFGRMTEALAEHFDRVLGLDVSPAMVDGARAAVTATNVEFRVVSGERLEGVADASADALVCYLVLQHVPRKRIALSLLREIGRVLAPQGEAFLQLPVLVAGAKPRAWRVLRGAVLPLTGRLSRRPTGKAAYRGFRLTEPELARGLEEAGLRVISCDESPNSPYRFSREVFLRVGR